jgi:integrase/recombinase XerD
MADQPKLAAKSVVSVYVRHKTSCSSKHRGEFTRTCHCPKWLRYSRNGRLHRRAAGTRTWSEAEGKAVELQESLDRGDTPKPIVVKAPQATIADAIETFIKGKESENVSARRIQKLKLQLDDFEQWMSARNKVFPSVVTASDVIDYRAGWDKKWKATTRIRAQQNLRGFLRTCCRDNLNSLLAALKPIKLSKEDKERLEPKPFSEKEIEVLIAQIPKSLAEEDIATADLLVRFMIASGVAIRDSVQLKRRSIKDCWLRFNRQKTDRPVRQRLDASLCKELLAGTGEYVFWEPTKMTIGGAVTKWQDDIRLLMQEAKVDGESLWIPGNTTHRFRDTAVDYWLGQGCSLTEIAAMLGDTLAVTERHYASLASHRMEQRLANLPNRSWEKK